MKKSSKINTLNYETSFTNQQIQSQILNPLSVFSCWLYCDWFFINKCKKSFISKPAFLNFVPQLIRKIYCANTM